MQGRSGALVVAIASTTLGLFITPFMLLGGAAVTLVTLRQGVAEGGWIVLGTLLAVGSAAYFSIGEAAAALRLVEVLAAGYVPLWLLGALWRSTASLSLTLNGLAILTAVAVAVLFAVIDDPQQWARTTLFGVSLDEFEPQLRQQLEFYARVETIVLLSYFSLAGQLMLGRWWQAILYNPGGFKQEFYRLRLGRTLALAAAVIWAGALASGGQGVLSGIGVAFLATFVLQGLAVVHTVTALTDKQSAWLFGVYGLLLFLTLPAMVILALVGAADNWYDFRARMQAKRGSGGAT